MIYNLLQNIIAFAQPQFLADRINVRCYATVLRPSPSSSVTLCIVATG